MDEAQFWDQRDRRSRWLRRLRAMIAGAAVLLAAGFALGRLTVPKQQEINPAALAQTSPEAKQTALFKFVTSTPKATASSATADPQQDWALTLVNADHPLAAGYEPPLVDIGNGYLFDSRAAQALQDMLSAAQAEGLHPIVCSGYRTQEKQQQLYDQRVQELLDTGLSSAQAEATALTTVAYPGTSEHQLGLAADIVALDNQRLDSGQAKTAEAQWLAANCSRFGFIVRYPPEKMALTGVSYEPWHYRYVGVKAATAIMEGGLCLEEYLGE